MNDMTKGHPLKKIIHFSIPLIIGNIFQLFYNMVDTLIVGRTMGVGALAGIGAAGSLMFLILGFSQGLTAGLAIPISQAFGAKDYKRVERSVLINWIIALIVSLILTCLSMLCLKPVLQLMGTPKEVIHYTYAYLYYIFLFLVVTVLYNMLNNMMRALGDSRTPLYFLIIAATVNIFLDYILIVYVGMGVAGAAVATIISQAIAVILCLITIYRNWPMLRIKHHPISHLYSEIIFHCKIALPMAFQTSIIAIGSVAVTVALNRLGALAVASFTSSQKIEQIVIQVLMSFGIAMATFVGQNFGAKQFDRIRTGVTQISLLSVAIALLFGIIIYFVGGDLVTLFAGGQEGQTMLAYGHTFFKLSSPFYALLSLLFIYRYTLQGIGDSLVPTLAGMMELIMRITAALILSQSIGFAGPAMSSPLAWLGSLILLSITYHHKKKHLDRLYMKYYQ